ncbi:MAG: hypothetical protein FLDDKLPJ_00383 [Phycisphaerae bacterium]|nr:hypothetical protein [Phycisphaerae bacterium]
MERLKVLITVKTYPIPSAKYDELVCTAGVREDGSFVRLYPVNFRDLPFSQQYKKYQWIKVEATKHKGRDARKESFRPDSDTIQLLGEPVSAARNWTERAQYVLAKKSASMEELYDQQKSDRTSLGIFKPKKIHDLICRKDAGDWKPSFKAALAQARLWEERSVSKEPPRKVPYKFQYVFECDDPRCNGRHRMMIEDWELGALYWKLVDKGASSEEAAKSVREKFLGDLCAVDRDTHFFVGTILAHPTTWVVIGVYWPKLWKSGSSSRHEPLLF